MLEITVFLPPNQLNRTAAARVLGPLAGIVQLEAAGQVWSVAGVKRPITSLENIDKKAAAAFQFGHGNPWLFILY